ELPVYTTTGLQDAPCRQLWGQANDNGVFSDPQAKTLYSSSIQEACIPNNNVACVRKNIGGLTCSDTDSYATTNNMTSILTINQAF
ncbi:MAG: hypothetical protein ACKPKO_40225, partial [Candidatus Fonsibacter sp.]